MNTVYFRHVTSNELPKYPIDATTYAHSEFPYFSIYEEFNDIMGNFPKVKSVGQSASTEEPVVRPRVVDLSGVGHNGQLYDSSKSSSCGIFSSNQDSEDEIRDVETLERKIRL